jgi:hypothetical protein
LMAARQRLVAVRSLHSENPRITTLINRLMGRLFYLKEPENGKHEEHLRKIITETIERAEQIASRNQTGQATFKRQADKHLRRMIDAKSLAEETSTNGSRVLPREQK